MRLLCAAAVSLTLGLFIAHSDDKKPADADRAESLKKLQKKFNDRFEELKAEFGKATTPAEQKRIRDELREDALIAAQDAVKIAEADPKDATGFDAALFVIEKAGRFGAGKEVEKAVGVIAEHHLNNPKVKPLLPVIAGAGPSGTKFLAAASEKATDKEVKGLALYFLGSSVAEQIEDEEDEKKINELVAKATEHFQRAAEAAPEVKVGSKTIAKEVAEQLESLKAVTALAVGKPAPELESTTLEGKKVKLSDYKGKVVLFDVWATWCPPCRAMIPHERELTERMKKDKKPFELVSFSADDKKDTLAKFLEKEPMPWTHWWDNGQDSPVLKKLRVRAFPTLYLIDHKGVIRKKWVGKPDNDALDKAVNELVAEADKAKG